MGIILAILVIIILLIVLYLRQEGAFNDLTSKLGGLGDKVTSGTTPSTTRMVYNRR